MRPSTPLSAGLPGRKGGSILARMRRGVPVFLVAWLAAAPAPGMAAAQSQAAADSPDGARLYAVRCADCHGADATGVRGPDLTRLWGRGATDDRVFQTIRQGVPGSIMAASAAPDAEIRAIVTFLKTFGTTDGPAPASAERRGAATAGETTFWTTCGGCHRIGARGGRLGPDLTRVGVTQSPAALRTAIREASRTITPGYQSVTLVARDGSRIRGLRRNEDAFSVQVLDVRERLQGYAKADLASLERDKASLMPSYGPDRLTDADLDDIVAFLAIQKGPK
jgi:putative heme-binding domain-containing protein